MKTLLLVIIIFATPLCLRAQDFRALGKSTREVRKLYASGPYITKLESDTCDTFLLSDSVRFRIFYKGGKTALKRHLITLKKRLVRIRGLLNTVL